MADLEHVWQVLTDIDGAPQVLTSVVANERLDGPEYGTGTRWRETRRIFGREETEELWVTEAVAPRSTTIESESGGTRYTTVFTCVPSGLGAKLGVAFSAVTPRPSLAQRIGWALFGKTGMRASQDALQQDLNDIAQVAERVRP